ncbi:hypothetical protein Taro_016209 [Colocasia esculenta]|uniref:Uncharacterized protein n=1 Tax=Colocasia esculenta TaxID=4460 RepID=A0A843USA2_COLES|nr:hypothetical protein [Colocasia esculenta]
MPGYNAILGRGLIGRLKVVPSSLHQKMKFPTPGGVGEVLGSQPESRRCYVLSLGDKRPIADPEVLPTPAEQPSTSRGSPAEDLLPVRVDGDPEHVLYIGAPLPEAEQQRYKAFLLANLDVFAWSDNELPGIPPEVMMHHLHLDPRVPPVQQRQRPVNQERQIVIHDHKSSLHRAPRWMWRPLRPNH